MKSGTIIKSNNFKIETGINQNQIGNYSWPETIKLGAIIPANRFGIFIEATGGIETEIIDNGLNYRVHTFNESGVFTVNNLSPKNNSLEYLIVAGGGGGSDYGGGGAGGYRCSVFGENSGGGNISEEPISATKGSHVVSVGTGGLGGISGGFGEDSAFMNITSKGGGQGGRQGAPSHVAGNGGSGGGAAPNSASTVGIGDVNQGFNGGSANSPSFLAGGGGGAGFVGGNGGSGNGGNGGDGVSSLIDGNLTFRAGGGGGGAGGSGSVFASGGKGGGGTGGRLNSGHSSGMINTGGGGGGTGTTSGTGRAGGSGVVILRYRIG